MDSTKLSEILTAHKKWLNNEENGTRADLRNADLRNADLRNADLCGADLRGADLRGANLDHSCWPLWCGSLSPKIDDRLARQLIYHVYRVVAASPDVSSEIKEALFTDALTAEANKFHRVNECGAIALPALTEERDVHA